MAIKGKNTAAADGSIQNPSVIAPAVTYFTSFLAPVCCHTKAQYIEHPFKQRSFS
jgi:hypothetical protein